MVIALIVLSVLVACLLVAVMGQRAYIANLEQEIYEKNEEALEAIEAAKPYLQPGSEDLVDSLPMLVKIVARDTVTATGKAARDAMAQLYISTNAALNPTNPTQENE